jgi:hypothetical protein
VHRSTKKSKIEYDLLLKGIAIFSTIVENSSTIKANLMDVGITRAKHVS